jgi:predicted glutamine amidotransferase
MYLADRPSAGGSSLIVATQVLDDSQWEPLPEDRVIVIRHGRLVSRSEKI